MTNHRLAAILLGSAGALLLPACSGNRGGNEVLGSSLVMDLEEVSNGFGQVLPHTIFRAGTGGQPTNEIVEIRSTADLVNNLTSENQVRRVPQFEPDPVLGSGLPGNHYIYARFTRPLRVSSVLDGSSASVTNGGLVGPIKVIAADPVTGDITNVQGRAFVGGRTYAGDLVDGAFQLQQWVTFDPDSGAVVAESVDNDQPGLGFPGTESFVAGAQRLVSPNTLLFVADTDGDLSTHETFPADVQIQMRIETSVISTDGKNLTRTALASTTVGADAIPPEVESAPFTEEPGIVPGNGDTDVDPLTTIRVRFSEPVQPLSIGPLPTGQVPSVSAAIQVQFGPDTARVTVPFTAEPISVFDLSRYELVPAFNFPGSGPAIASCGVFNKIDVTVQSETVFDLSFAGNTNVDTRSTSFETGNGPAIVNAPVTPDTVYVAATSGEVGVSVIDLNGFGAGTGNHVVTINPDGSIARGSSNVANNPNIRFQSNLLVPQITVQTCTLNGGSAGVFTLALDSNLQALLISDPLVRSVDDMHVGQALDAAFNNGPAPFGCQAAGGGNLCALSGLKQPTPVVGLSSIVPAAPGQFSTAPPGAPNLVSWAPHPNPPPLTFPPLCVSPFIGAQEPTSIAAVNPATGIPIPNLLTPGDPFGNPLAGVPPSGLLTQEQNSYFQGPSSPQTVISACLPYQIRQQIGHFLYLVDRGQRQLVIVNSNRMTVIDRIALSDPTSLATSPNVDLLAVSNQTGNLVSFIDIDPTSSTFHQVIHQTIVGERPRGLAWQSENEDVVVCNEGDDSLSLISAGTLEVRKTVSAQLNQPFEVALTPRMTGFGWARAVYFGYILNRNGDLALYESGPSAINGWGYDDLIGVTPLEFRNPKTIQIDQNRPQWGAAWIVHEGPLDPDTSDPGPIGEGAVTLIQIESAIQQAIPLSVQFLLIPQIRDMSIAMQSSFGEDQLSGIPTDIAFDNLRSWGGLPNLWTVFSIGSPAPVNGKGLMRPAIPVPVSTNTPAFCFVAVPNPSDSDGVVDVFNLSTLQRVDVDRSTPGIIDSIAVPGANVIADYWRQ